MNTRSLIYVYMYIYCRWINSWTDKQTNKWIDTHACLYACINSNLHIDYPTPTRTQRCICIYIYVALFVYLFICFCLLLWTSSNQDFTSHCSSKGNTKSSWHKPCVAACQELAALLSFFLQVHISFLNALNKACLWPTKMQVAKR